MTDDPVTYSDNHNRNRSINDTVARAIEAKQLDLLYNQNHLAALSTVVAGLLLGWILWDVVDRQHISIWIGVLLTASVVRVALVWQYRRIQPEQTDIQRWRSIMLGIAFLFGVIWGSASLFLFPQGSMPHIAFMGFVIAGIAGGAVPYLAAIWPVYLLTALPATLLYTVRLFMLGGTLASTMGMLVLFFSAMMVFTSWRMKETVIESIKLRFDKEALARDLEQVVVVKEQATLVAKESDERVQVLADAPFEGIFIHEHGQILDANRTLLNMLGLQLEDALGRMIEDFIPDEFRQKVRRELQDPTGAVFSCAVAIPGGGTIDVEVRGRHFPRKGRTIRVVSLRQIN